MEEDTPENAEQPSQTPQVKVDVEALNSPDSSLSLSLSISEHIDSNSIENDRSFQEIEVNNQSYDNARLSQTSNPFSLNNSSVSLNFKNSGEENVESVLNEILNNSGFKSESNTSKEESLDIFANLDLSDKSLSLFRQGDLSDINERNKNDNNYGEVVKRIKDFEEIINVKDTAIQALTSELDSYREMSNTNTMSIVSTTEYKQLQEECQNKLLEYNNAILYKNDLILQLSESLDQSVLERKLLLAQIDNFKDEIAQLQGQLEETTEMVKSHQCNKKTEPENVEDDVDSSQKIIIQPLSSIDYKSIENCLNEEQLNLFQQIKTNVDKYLEDSLEEKKLANKKEMEGIKSAMSSEKEEYELEIKRLRDMLANIKCGSTEIMELRNELEAKYLKEMEELRTYFEKKYSDLEKKSLTNKKETQPGYSEEIFSQHSRKMSGSSCSENDLSTDMLFANTPGPGGDSTHDHFCKPNNITHKDVNKLKDDLQNILKSIENYDLDNLQESDVDLLKEDLQKCSINNIVKYDLTNIKKDLQNKYHAELMILSEENEHKLDEIKLDYERKLKDLEEKYEEEIKNLKSQVQVYNVSSSVQEVANSGDYELNEVVQSYERRLQEQVTFAKIDIIADLENQIQRLVANESDEWPSELLQLRDRFTDKYERQILEIRLEHEDEIAKLKDEHLKALNGALERARRRSLRDSDSLNKGEMELLKERDSLKKQTVSLRNLLGELLKYFTQCEDELNNTLVDELLKQGFEKTLTQLEDQDLTLNDSSVTTSSKTDTSSYVKRVHLAPNFSDLIGIIEKQANSDLDDVSLDASSIDFKNELGNCLHKLKQDANAILALTNNIPKADLIDSPRKSVDEKVTSLTRQLISETQVKEKLKQELEDATSVIASLENNKNQMENELDTLIQKYNILETDLIKSKDKIAELIENGHKEIVSVGYGDSGQKNVGDTMQNLLDLQEKARNILLSKSVNNADPVLLNLIEELCRVCEMFKEEHLREKDDLLQQIEAADKKYRQTRQFLDEQANERESERDDAQKKIDMLQERLKERERDRTSCQRYTSEVEHLESQIQELNTILSQELHKHKETESERDEAVEKIKVLREIIRDLEQQTDTYQSDLKTNLETIEKLRCIVESQNRSLEDTKNDHSLLGFSDVTDLKRHIDSLEEELQQLRVSAELSGGEGVQSKVRVQLQELEVALEKKTKALEGLYCGTNNSCSSPSEDLSVRDLLRPHTPNSMVFDDCEVPLAQLARLKEKLVRHSRAEDAAIKKIRDLEMQIFNLKSDIEENLNEKEILKRQIQEHLVLISDLQIRLDEQRIRAEHNEKQINNSLEVKIYDLQNEITNLNELLQKKDKNINHLNSIIEETKRHMKKQEQELLKHQDDDLITSMQKELEHLRQENNQMKAKMSKEAQILPNLVENIISDKNTDIGKLSDKLQDTQRKLEDYTSLNLSLKELQTISHLKKSGNSLTEIISLVDISQPDQMRYLYDSNQESQPQQEYIRNKNETVFLSCEPEISRIEKIPLLKSNSTELFKSLEKRVHFEDDLLEKLQSEIDILKNEIKIKEEIIKNCEERLKNFSDLESKITMLQSTLEVTEQSLLKTQETFEKEQKQSHELQQNLKLELAEKKLKLTESEKKVTILESDSKRKDQMLVDLSSEKRDLEKEMTRLKHENYQNVDKVINEKNQQIYKLRDQLEKASATEELRELNAALEESYKNLERVNENLKGLEEKYANEVEKNEKLEKEIENHSHVVTEYKNEIEKLNLKISKKRERIIELEKLAKTNEIEIKKLTDQNKNFSNLLLDKNCEIEILNEDLKHYQTTCNKYEDQSDKNMEKILKEKEMIIKNIQLKNEELNNELLHLQDLVGNKDKIIEKISDDHKKVNSNLVTIQKKIREPGGLVDTRVKLKEEQKKNVALMNEIHILKAQAVNAESKKNIDVDEIANKVKQELDFAAELDSNIITAVSDQSLNSISESQDLEKLKEELSKCKNKNTELLQRKKLLEKDIRDLESKLQLTENDKQALESQFDSLNYNLQKIQYEDARLIEQMRLRLDTALSNEEEFGKIIDEEKVTRKNLELELDLLKTKSNTESTKYKTLPNNEEKYRQELKLLQDKYEKLKRVLKTSEVSKKELDNNLNCVKKMLDLEKERTKNMEERLKVFFESDRELKDQARRGKLLMEQKLWEIERLKGNVSELQKERENLARERQNAFFNINSTNPFLDEPVHEIVMKKIQEINGLLLDNKAMVDLITKLRNEKGLVEKELISLKGKHPNLVENSDLKKRCDFLFAKTLRLDSNRKALLWQKRYLMDVIKNHEIRCKVALLGTLKANNRMTERKQNSIIKFRSVVTAVISIHRMKYMVRRWQSGIRATAQINSRYSDTQNHQGGRPLQNNPPQSGSQHRPIVETLDFHVGQPVSNSRFTVGGGLAFPGTSKEAVKAHPEVESGGENGDCNSNLSWSGRTPPQKDKKKVTATTRIGNHLIKQEDLQPLRAPQLLAQFAERIDTIQETMGLALDSDEERLNIIYG